MARACLRVNYYLQACTTIMYKISFDIEVPKSSAHIMLLTIAGGLESLAMKELF